MASFEKDRLYVSMIPPATASQPIEGRKYTLTHSDTTGQLFLAVGYDHDYAAINTQMRDEVLAWWQSDCQYPYILAGKVYIDNGEHSEKVSKKRFDIFSQEMNVALKGIIYGDWPFLNNYPFLLNAPIYIHFESNYPQYNQTLYFGTPMSYLDK